MAKKKEEEAIDEDFLIASMNMSASSTQSSATSQAMPKIEAEPESPTPKEENRKKKTRGDYESLFIRPTLVCGRQEKTTYLREEFYNRIMKVVLLYQNPKLSVFAYVDAVLEHHFELYKQEIIEIYKQKNSPPF